MFESMQNNVETHIGDNSDHSQGSGEQALCHVPPNFNEMPPIPSELANNIRKSNYWLALVAKLMNRIPQVHTKTPPKDDKLANMVARRV